MSVNPALMLARATEGPAARGTLRVREIQFLPGSGGVPIKEISGTQNASAPVSSARYEGEMQLNPPDEIEVYQFCTQHGSLTLKVPSRQWLRLPHQIPHELAPEAACRKEELVGFAGGNNHGR
jgi:hypothetical protein